MARVVVIGSSNTDMVIKTRRFPKPGETILGGEFFMFHGGKGANQAVAAARLGAEVVFICAVGDDLFGSNALAHYGKEGIMLQGVQKMEGQASGIALITIDESGENEIVVAPGANNLLTSVHILSQNSLLGEASILLTQLETPLEVLYGLVEHCAKSGQRLILNPAPARKLDKHHLNGLFLLTPNQTEAGLITGMEVMDEAGAEVAAKECLQLGVQNLIITMGSRGAFFMNATENFWAEAPDVKAIDTTAAGDIFNGALAVAIARNQSWKEAVQFGIKAASLSVTRMGAQNSAPFLHEIK